MLVNGKFFSDDVKNYHFSPLLVRDENLHCDKRHEFIDSKSLLTANLILLI
jgi:hypothetical protein